MSTEGTAASLGVSLLQVCRRNIIKPEMDGLAFPRTDIELIMSRDFSPDSRGVYSTCVTLDDIVVDSVFNVRTGVGSTENALEIGPFSVKSSGTLLSQ